MKDIEDYLDRDGVIVIAPATFYALLFGHPKYP